LDKGKDNSDADYEEKKDVLFKKGIDEMKISTRRYAKTQIKWVKNVFVKSMFVK
jgi:tRNA A37 N6-isopentenylltransferase MiaA